MERRIRVAAVGDNCMDCYDDLGKSFPGGNPVNVAVYIRRLGGEASYTGAVGTDDSGRLMVEAIRQKGVDTSHVQVLEGETAVSHVQIVDGDRVFGEYQEGVLADFQLRPEDISFLCAQDLVVTGIWGMIEGELPRIIQNVPVAFDFANKFASPVVDQALPYVTYAFFSYDEEAKEEFAQRYQSLGLEPKDSEEELLGCFMEAVQSKGPRVVVVTRGSKGSLAWDGKQRYRYGIAKCEVVDTMGAGDSFIAGFLYGILQGRSIPEAMEAGAENSAVTLGYSGAW